MAGERVELGIGHGVVGRFRMGGILVVGRMVLAFAVEVEPGNVVEAVVVDRWRRLGSRRMENSRGDSVVEDEVGFERWCREAGLLGWSRMMCLALVDNCMWIEDGDLLDMNREVEEVVCLAGFDYEHLDVGMESVVYSVVLDPGLRGRKVEVHSVLDDAAAEYESLFLVSVITPMDIARIP